MRVRQLKIIIPIAGVGKRLQPFTFSKPKALLKIAGKTMLDHTMDMLKAAFPEGTEMLFVVGYKKEMIVKQMTEKYGDYFQLQFVEQKQRGIVDDVPIFPGLGHAIWLARDSGFLPADDAMYGMFIILSDRLPIDGFTGIYNEFQASSFDGIINTSIVDHPEHYGVVEVDQDNQITRIVEKPKIFISNQAVAGFYVFDAAATGVILEYLEQAVKEPIKEDQEYQFTPALQHAIEQGIALSFYQMQHEVIDIGQPGPFLDGNRFFLEALNECNTRLVDERACIDNVNVVQPACIGKGTKITNSIIGPYVSIGDNVEITRSIVENTVIGDGSLLNRVITSDSIIGDEVMIEDIIKPRITVGDRSSISSRNNSTA
jgi:glucose-1-phosphate thymidylyltransferase